jgi:hypothetical protein
LLFCQEIPTGENTAQHRNLDFLLRFLRCLLFDFWLRPHGRTRSIRGNTFRLPTPRQFHGSNRAASEQQLSTVAQRRPSARR